MNSPVPISPVPVVLYTESGPVLGTSGVLVDYPAVQTDLIHYSKGQLALISPWPDNLGWDDPFCAYIPATPRSADQWVPPTSVGVMRYSPSGSSIGVVLLHTNPEVPTVSGSMIADIGALESELETNGGDWYQALGKLGNDIYKSLSADPHAFDAAPGLAPTVPPQGLAAVAERSEMRGARFGPWTPLCRLLRLD